LSTACLILFVSGKFEVNGRKELIPDLIIFSLFAAQFILEDAKNYTFMTMGGLRVPGIEDPEEFNQTIASMKVIIMPTHSNYNHTLKRTASRVSKISWHCPF
jgi:hypothetical protein